jgi:acylphosphatase
VWEPPGYLLPDGSVTYYGEGAGQRFEHLHGGVDYALNHGTELYACADGQVSSAGWDATGFGSCLQIDHGPVRTLLGHLSEILVSPGQRVTRGQLVARVGSSGNSTGPHLHWSVIDIATGHYLDPSRFLQLEAVSPEPVGPRWESLGGQVDKGLAVSRNQDGRLEVLVRGTDSRLYHRYQLAPNGGWSKGWESLGGEIPGRIVALTNQDGRIAVFARGTDQTLWHLYQVAPNKGWSGWQPLDRDPARRVAIGGLLVGERTGKNQLALFARRPSDGVLLQRGQVEAGGGWTEWAPLDERVRVEGALAVGKNQGGRLEVIARDPQGMAHRIKQQAPGVWTGSRWERLGSKAIGPRLLAVGRNQDGRLVAFAQGTDQGKTLWHIWQQEPGKGWAPEWVSLGGSINGVMAVAAREDGRLEVVARGGDNALWHICQQEAGRSWSSWESLGGKVADLLAVGRQQDGRLAIFAQGADQALWHLEQTS